MKRIISIFLPLLSALCLYPESVTPPPAVVAYVTSWTDEVPDPEMMTHLNYAFGHVNDTFDGVRIDNPGRLRKISRLKQLNPDLKILLSVGGWRSGRFSEMAADPALRKAFAADCNRIVTDFGIDGIDIDWEYPGSDAAGISASVNDKDNFIMLLAELRQRLGYGKLLTIASEARGEGCLFDKIVPLVDFINIMAYDMNRTPLHHSPLRRSPLAGATTVEEAVDTHIKAGVPPEKLVLGLPFYGRGRKPYSDFVNYGDITVLPGCTMLRDPESGAPYIAGPDGKLVLGFDDTESMARKCRFAKEKGLKGVMYWDYSGDDTSGTLRKLVRDSIAGSPQPKPYPANYAKAPRFKALLYYSETAETAHVEFASQASEFFHRLTYGEGFILDKTTSLAGFSIDSLKSYNLIIDINTAPVDPAERALFENYIEQGGGWLGFHAAGYNDSSTRWEWFNRFLGAGTFFCNNWPPQPALLEVETSGHPVTRNLPESFVAPECEWYQWSPSPRLNPDVDVLLSLSPRNYPLGIKDVVNGGDFPVVWTNTRYRMVYLNIGHGDREFSDATQNLLIVNAFRWIVSRSPSGNPFDL